MKKPRVNVDGVLVMLSNLSNEKKVPEFFQKYAEASVTCGGGTSIIPGLHPILPKIMSRIRSDMYVLVLITI
jgi:hypothetical protein